MKHSLTLRLIVLAAALPLLTAADWPTFHRDNTRQGFDGQQVPFNSVTPGWSSPLDGRVYAEPLVVGNRVYVATENNSVYAFDATTGTQVWNFNAGPPVPNSQLAPGCGNVDPVGITGTPAIDAVAGRLYAVAQVAPTTYDLVELDINTGTAVNTFPITNFTGFNGLVFDPRFQNQRGALAFANGNVYIPYGGRIGDCQPYEGVVIAVPINGAAQFHWDTPTNAGAGMWATGGVAIDGSGNIYAATGNAGCPSSYDYNDGVIKLGPTLNGVQDFFAPSDWLALSCADADLGSAGPVLIDNGLGFIQGKEPTAYLYNLSNMGRVGGQVFAGPGCSSESFGGAAYMAPYIYVPCTNGLVALKVNYSTSPVSFTTAWTQSGSFSGPPIIAGGAVWSIGHDNNLHAYDPVTGQLRYSHAVGPFTTSFPTPGAGAGQVFVANNSTIQSFVLNQTCSGGTTPVGVGAGGSTTFYFAEGYTGPGFAECLALFMPNVSGTATIDYYTQTAHTIGTVSMTAGQVATVNVNRVVGPTEEVSVKVTLPGPGVVERLLRFQFAGWHGSTDKVGVTAPNTEWDFAEGSTLSPFNEYLTLQNPNGTPVLATLIYMSETGILGTKTLTLNANTRRTVEVFSGTPTGTCTISDGPGANCGVGRGWPGVSTRVTTPVGQPIVAERPMYVNGYSFGYGPIRDGHDAFGATGPATRWSFAEGTTLAGFSEYLTLQNPGASPSQVTVRYMDELGNVMMRSFSLSPSSRFTVEVFNTAFGVGPGLQGVSAQVTATQPVVVERPMYIHHDFGSGIVAGAHVVVGATGFGTLFGFASASTLIGENDFLTVQNPGNSVANVQVDYYTAGGKVTRTTSVAANSRLTMHVWDATEGVGTGQPILGIVVTSTNAVPILVEKPTYGANASSYGATDTMGYSPASF